MKLHERIKELREKKRTF